MLHIDSHPRPRRRSAAHRVDQDVGGLQISRRLRMSFAPALVLTQCILLALRPRDLDQRMTGTTSRWRHA